MSKKMDNKQLEDFIKNDKMRKMYGTYSVDELYALYLKSLNPQAQEDGSLSCVSPKKVLALRKMINDYVKCIRTVKKEGAEKPSVSHKNPSVKKDNGKDLSR